MAGEVLVDIHAASINGVDWRIRSGRYKKITKFPYVLGRDFSGVVVAVGKGVQSLRVGDPVFGVCEPTQDGAYAERIAIRADKVARKPDWLSHIKAAAIALTGLTAIISIEHTLNLRRGERILIQGGAGGVGGFAVQLAHYLGATVVTTARAENHDYLRKLGADKIIDYRNQPLTNETKCCDAVLDTVGGAAVERSFNMLRPGGRAAFIASGTEAPVPPSPDIQSLRPQVVRDSVYLERILELYQTNAVCCPKLTVFDLSEATKAHQISESRHFRGKLVLHVNQRH